jgi:hypothetical protein
VELIRALFSEPNPVVVGELTAVTGGRASWRVLIVILFVNTKVANV